MIAGGTGLRATKNQVAALLSIEQTKAKRMVLTMPGDWAPGSPLRNGPAVAVGLLGTVMTLVVLVGFDGLYE
jgi:hypothetical protein